MLQVQTKHAFTYSMALLLEIPQYLDEAGWTGHGKVVACTQVTRLGDFELMTLFKASNATNVV